jgi:hypothetical protein
MGTSVGELFLQGVNETFRLLEDLILEDDDGEATETATRTTQDYSTKKNHMTSSPRTRHEAKNREDFNAERRSQFPTKRSSQNDVPPTNRSYSRGRKGESRDQPQRHLSPARVAMVGERGTTKSPQRKRVPEQKNKKNCRPASSGHRSTRRAPDSSRQSSVGKKVPIDPKYRHSKSPETEVRRKSQSRRSASPNKARRKAVRTPCPTTKQSPQRSMSMPQPRKETEVDCRDMPETKRADRQETKQLKPMIIMVPDHLGEDISLLQDETNVSWMMSMLSCSVGGESQFLQRAGKKEP